MGFLLRRRRTRLVFRVCGDGKPAVGVDGEWCHGGKKGSQEGERRRGVAWLIGLGIQDKRRQNLGNVAVRKLLNSVCRSMSPPNLAISYIRSRESNKKCTRDARYSAPIFFFGISPPGTLTRHSASSQVIDWISSSGSYYSKRGNT